jgi:hypothetical protein
MRSIKKIVSCLILIFLTISPFFASTIVSGQEVKATCEAIAKEEAYKWPGVAYCSKPLRVENKDGEAVYFPDDKDAWTEKQYFIDNYGWIASNAKLSTDRKVGQYSFYGESKPLTSGLTFFLWPALNGKSLDYISIYDELHFWFKSPDSGTFNAYLMADNVGVQEI